MSPSKDGYQVQLELNHNPPGICMTFESSSEANRYMNSGLNSSYKQQISDNKVILKFSTNPKK